MVAFVQAFTNPTGGCYFVEVRACAYSGVYSAVVCRYRVNCDKDYSWIVPRVVFIFWKKKIRVRGVGWGVRHGQSRYRKQHFFFSVGTCVSP